MFNNFKIDVSQPEDTEEGELATQEEGTLKDAESSTVKKKFFLFPVLLYVNKHVWKKLCNFF